MGKIPSRRSRRSRKLVREVTEAVVEQVGDALTNAPEPEVPDAPKVLSGLRECRGSAACGLIFKAWSGRPAWRCGVCGFQTFDKAEAAPRAAAVGRSSIIGADHSTENHHAG